ncbi:BspA family leucine-rich repeat surface protein [Enterococcus sp. AZ029]|uniref:BspA family leucine-rich repeat surface protein n=1 Tax=Enterococcus sp. AZ029 TaxID=2774841 RepID=UPI003F299BBC
MSKKKLTKKKKKQLLALFATTTMTVNMAMAPLSVLAEENESSDAVSVGNVLEENMNLPAETMTSDVEGEKESTDVEEKVEEKEIKTTESAVTEKEEIEEQETDNKTKVGTLTGSYENDGTWTFNQENGLLVLSGGTLSASISADSWLKEIKKADVLEIQVVKAVGAEDLSALFSDYNKIMKITFDQFDTSKVTNMDAMFYDCVRLTKLNLSNFDTSNVTDMSNMFRNCFVLTTLDASSFNTSRVTTMKSMFHNCSSLSALDVSNFDTSNVTNMYNLFYNCSSLSVLDVSNFDTSNVTNMFSMFNSCSGLTTLDVSNFDTSNVTTMQSMFHDSTGLTDLDLSNFDTSNVTSMFNMFRNCLALTTLDASNLDTGKVATMQGMFDNCESLEKLTLGNATKLAADTNLRALTADEFWYGKLEGNELGSSDDLITYHNELSETNTYTLVSKGEETVFEIDDYYIGDYYITGQFSAPIVTAQLRINGEISNRGGTFNKIDGTFYYYAGAGRIQVNQEVVLEGLNEQGEIVKDIKIEPKVKEGSLNNVQYALGGSTIVGEYTGNMSKARLVVNGTIVSIGGTFKDGVFSYWATPGMLKETDKIQLQGYDAKGNPLGDLTPVAVQKQSGQLLEANYTMGHMTINGKYEGTVKKGRLIVDGKSISWGGTFKDGVFSYYVTPGTIKAESVVELATYGDGDVLLSDKNFTVAIQE